MFVVCALYLVAMCWLSWPMQKEVTKFGIDKNNMFAFWDVSMSLRSTNETAVCVCVCVGVHVPMCVYA